MSTPVDRARPWEDGLKSTRIRSSSPPPSGSETAAERLTDDLLVEILSRVPGRSLCRFKCVSKHWLGLINDRTYRRKFPRTLTGFFFSSTTEEQLVHPVLPFTNLSGSRSSTSLTFLPNGLNAFLLDCCNGLLLYDVSSHLGKRRYVVCNPATGEWTELPHCDHAGWVGIVHLGFDPAVSPHFYVFLLTDQLNGFGLPGVDVCSYVYSSETERWVHQEKKWYWDIDLVRVHSAAYLNGCLHFFAEVNHNTLCLAADKEAGTMIYSHVPPLNDGFMQQSQGCLYYAGFGRDDNDDHVVRLLVYVLEDYNNKEWILKHSIESSHLLGGRHDVDIEEDFC
ncbi:F-box protein At5g07610-like [Triticum aestivum]|uniref:F-box protein At5g07610-like n=1 Tax=Triticum aestivum TaxID=4565 RepID=UPI001D0184C2|nr:F-box protein At5g07610-like [Triticum aestivum]